MCAADLNPATQDVFSSEGCSPLQEAPTPPGITRHPSRSLLARELLRALGFVSGPEVLQVQGVGQIMGTPHLHQKLLLLSGICQMKPSITGWEKKKKKVQLREVTKVS